jgi:allantoinase
MSAGLAALVGLTGRKGAVAPGYDADLVVFDPDKPGTIRTEAVQHRHKMTPYAARGVSGEVEATFLRGQLVYERGTFPNPGRGVPVLRSFDA